VIYLSILLFLIPAQALADFSGSVVSVLDGDTIEVLHNQHPERVRLNGIDRPEKGQAFGYKAKKATSALAFGRGVTVLMFGTDKCSRNILDLPVI
jgi:micrococcal nuclease